MSPCNPVCDSGEICTESGRCMTKQPDSANQQTSAPNAIPPSTTDDSTLLAAMMAQEEQRMESGRREQHKKFALLINPAAVLLSVPMYGFVSIPLNIQIGAKYAGVDFVATGIFGDVSAAAIEMGARFTPMGRGLSGFYIVPRIGVVGGDIPVGFVGSGELGWAWIVNSFAINLGFGVSYFGEVGVLPFGNLSMGFAL